MKENIINELKRICDLNVNEYVIKRKVYNAKFDFENEFLFITTSNENLSTLNYDNYCEYENFKLYDLWELDDLSSYELRKIYELLKEVK